MSAALVLTPEQVREIVFLYKVWEFSTYQIAERFDVCPTTVRRRLHHEGIKLRSRGGSRPQPVDEGEREILQYLYEAQKLSQPEIAQVLGTTTNWVAKRFVRFGIPRRNPSQSMKLFHMRQKTHHERRGLEGLHSLAR